VIVGLLKEIKSSDVNREIGFLEPRIVLSYCGVVWLLSSPFRFAVRLTFVSERQSAFQSVQPASQQSSINFNELRTRLERQRKLLVSAPEI
jgi:hypothetical protein